MNNRDVTRELPDGTISSGESADLIAIQNGDSGIDGDDNGDDEYNNDNDEIDEGELSPEDPDAYPYELDGSGDGSDELRDDSDDEDDDNG